MEYKKVTATKYYVSRIDDIGEEFYVECVCPNCGKQIQDHGLEGFTDSYNPFLYYSMVVKCPHCEEICIAVNPNK